MKIIYGSGNVRCDRQKFLSFWAIFCTFCPLTTQIIKKKKWKNEKMHGDITILYMCTINNIHDVCDRHNFLSFWTIFYPFTPLKTRKIKILKKWKITWRYYHFTHVYNKWQSYNVCFLRYGAWQTDFFVILDCFLPLYPPKNQKYQNIEKLKKITWDIIIFHKCTKNHDQMLYYCWDMACNRCNCYFSFWTIFCTFNSSFTSITSPKNQN